MFLHAGILELLVSNIPGKLQEASKAIKLGDYQTAHDLLIELLKEDVSNVDALYLISYVAENVEQRIQALKLALRYDPDHKLAQDRLQKQLLRDPELDDIFAKTSHAVKAEVDEPSHNRQDVPDVKELVNQIRKLPMSYYWPIPPELPDSYWGQQSACIGVDFREASQLELAHHVFSQYAPEFDFPLQPTPVAHEFWLDNPFFSQFDPPVYYALLRHFKPRRIIEVGAGMSTRLAAHAINRSGNNAALIAIEPHPDSVLQKGFPGLTKLIEKPVQEVEFALCESLNEGDVLFIDSSHVVVTGGDVTFLFLEVIPRLKPGVLIHIHDILLPGEYAKWHIVDNNWFWNEQYLLHAFLAFNPSFEVVFSNSYLGSHYPQLLRSIFPNAFPKDAEAGVSFWMRKKH